MELFYSDEILTRLLKDWTTGENIYFVTNSYEDIGIKGSEQITLEILHSDKFKLLNRAEKNQANRSKRQKDYAEVFTPTWVIRDMNNVAENEYTLKENAFMYPDKIEFKEGITWQDFVNSTRLEITCGEAPYLVNRYDVSNGESIPLGERVGMLDRKLRVVHENCSDKDEALEWIYKAYQATYGYELQGR